MALLGQSLQRPNALRRLRFSALKGSSRSCRISSAGSDARGLLGVLSAVLSVAGGVGQAVLAFGRVGRLLAPTILGLVLAPVWIAPVGSLGQGEGELESTAYYPRLRAKPGWPERLLILGPPTEKFAIEPVSQVWVGVEYGSGVRLKRYQGGRY